MSSRVEELELPNVWLVGQAVKTSASHAENRGSIPLRVTRGMNTRECEIHIYEVVGVDYDEGPPVPIPNTEVKLISAEDTWLETARDNRKMPTQIVLNSSAGRACGC